jgi:hypothetical protein
MLATTNDRIFVQGKDANGTPLGSYSEGYLNTRLKVSRSNSKINLQFTGQMESDFVVINTGNEIGLGFNNSSGQGKGILNAKKVKSPGNTEKSYLVEATYGVPIFQSTDAEVDKALEIFEKNVKEILNG